MLLGKLSLDLLKRQSQFFISQSLKPSKSGKTPYSDLFFRLHGIRHTLNCIQYSLSISYLNMYPLKRKGKNYRLISFRIFISLFADTDINTEKKLKYFSGDFPAVSVQFFSFFKMADTI